MKALTALTLGKKKVDTVARLTPIPTPDPQSDVLFEMFNGALGSVHLGRLLKGHDAGRLVTLRKVRGNVPPDFAAAADLARSIAHPKLAKVLGVVRERDATYLASEHISGVTLFELGRQASNRQLPVAPAVAVRIIIDALAAASVAQELLESALHAEPVRCVYPESIWIADYGETFVSEVLVAPLLAQPSAGAAPHSELSVAAGDVRAAALELARLTCAGLSADDPLDTDLSSLPEELQEVLTRALGHGSMVGYPNLEAFLDALAGLDPSLIAAEEEVGAELLRLMGTVLNVRRQKLDMLERGSTASDIEDQGDETKFFRLAVKTEQRATARPPADGSAPSSAKLAAAMVAEGAAKRPAPPPPPSSTQTPLAVVPAPGSMREHIPAPPSVRPEAVDEPTLLFRREETGIARSDWFGSTSLTDADTDAGADPVEADSFVRTKDERLAFGLPVLSPNPLPSAPPQPRRSRKGLVLALLGFVLVAAGVARGAYVAQRDHSSFGEAVTSDLGAVQRALR